MSLKVLTFAKLSYICPTFSKLLQKCEGYNIPPSPMSHRGLHFDTISFRLTSRRPSCLQDVEEGDDVGGEEGIENTKDDAGDTTTSS